MKAKSCKIHQNPPLRCSKSVPVVVTLDTVLLEVVTVVTSVAKSLEPRPLAAVLSVVVVLSEDVIQHVSLLLRVDVVLLWDVEVACQAMSETRGAGYLYET